MSKCNHGTQSGVQVGPVIWKAGSLTFEIGRKSLVMGILNITPDSFSDGGRFSSISEAVREAKETIIQGADILDIGGESTRPGAAPVSLSEELARVIPIIQALASETQVALSIDTCKYGVAKAALDAGAHIVNDISGLRDDRMVEVCAGSDCGVVVMHMKGTPQTMQGLASYEDVVFEVRSYFEERYETLTKAGINADRIVFDPGIGFGKTLDHNLALINGVAEYTVNKRPILMGLSRKTFIGTLLGKPEMSCRDVPTQALTALTRLKGAMIHRVHQVYENFQALRMLESTMD